MGGTQLPMAPASGVAQGHPPLVAFPREETGFPGGGDSEKAKGPHCAVGEGLMSLWRGSWETCVWPGFLFFLITVKEVGEGPCSVDLEPGTA